MLVLIISIVIISMILFKNLFFKSTYLLKSFGELSVDPEIAFTNNKPTFLEFYAEWCEVCKEMAPQVSAFKDEFEKDINFQPIFRVVYNSYISTKRLKNFFCAGCC